MGNMTVGVKEVVKETSCEAAFLRVSPLLSFVVLTPAVWAGDCDTR